jgi:hypothetical protein
VAFLAGTDGDELYEHAVAGGGFQHDAGERGGGIVTFGDV